MQDNYIRCLTRVVPVDATWAEGYVEPHVIASVHIVRHGQGYLVRITVIDKCSRAFVSSKFVATLSEAATQYERLLDTIFYAIPDNVTPDWLIANGFVAREN